MMKLLSLMEGFYSMRSFRGLFAGVCLLALAGCGGGSGSKVGGKIVKGGSPVSLAEGEGYSITMVSSDQAQKDGSFSIKGPSGDLVPEGKYKVNYVHYMPANTAGKGAPPVPVPRNLKEEWAVTSGPDNTFTIDISRK
jgi:hypothetical protein